MSVEDETSLSYRYGGTQDAQTDQVTSRKETGEVAEATAEDGGLVAGWVQREHRETGAWIPRGVIAS